MRAATKRWLVAVAALCLVGATATRASDDRLPKGAIGAAGKAAVSPLGEGEKDVWVGFWAATETKKGFHGVSGAAIVNPGAGKAVVRCTFLDREGSILRTGLAYVAETHEVEPGSRVECFVTGFPDVPCSSGLTAVVEGTSPTENANLSDTRGWLVITSSRAVLPAPAFRAGPAGLPVQPFDPGSPFYRVDCEKPGAFAVACEHAKDEKPPSDVIK